MTKFTSSQLRTLTNASEKLTRITNLLKITISEIAILFSQELPVNCPIFINNDPFIVLKDEQTNFKYFVLKQNEELTGISTGIIFNTKLNDKLIYYKDFTNDRIKYFNGRSPLPSDLKFFAENLGSIIENIIQILEEQKKDHLASLKKIKLLVNSLI